MSKKEEKVINPPEVVETTDNMVVAPAQKEKFKIPKNLLILLLVCVIALPGAYFLYNTFAATAPVNNANCTALDVPETLKIGTQIPFEVTCINTGTTTWSLGNGNYSLGTQNPQDSKIWGQSRLKGVSLTSSISSNLPPGKTALFRATLTAPQTAGTYSFSWKMLKLSSTANIGTTTKGGTGEWFGNTTLNQIKVVTDSLNNAFCTQPTLSSNPYMGQKFSASVKCKNIGTTTWTQETGYWLTIQPKGDQTWGNYESYSFSSSSLSYPYPGKAYPGKTATFNIVAIAPSKIGTFPFSWKMYVDPNCAYYSNGQLGCKTTIGIPQAPTTTFGNIVTSQVNVIKPTEPTGTNLPTPTGVAITITPTPIPSPTGVAITITPTPTN